LDRGVAVAGGHRHPGLAERSEVFEDAGLRLKMAIHRHADVCGGACRGASDLGEALGPGDPRDLPEQDPVDDAEDGGVGRDGDGERRKHPGHDQGAAPVGAEGVPDVLEDTVHGAAS
jgi:hypothetical protein